MTRDDLIATHTTRWHFRPRGPFEGAQQYVDAVIAYLETRDWAAAYEVRLGKAQADWTPAEVKGFSQHLQDRRGPQGGPDATPVSATFIEAASCPCSLDALRELARAATDHLMALRRKTPLGDLPIFVQVVTIDGEVRVTTASSSNRLGVLMAAARQMPLYGFVLTFDAFMHGIDPVHGTATKRDAFLTHIGTRTDRLLLNRRYTVTGRTVTFDDEQEVDIRAGRTPDGNVQQFVDPYTEVFVTVPPVTRPQ